MLMHPQIVPRRCHCMDIGAAARVDSSCTCSCMRACLRLNAAHQHGCTHHYGISNYCCRHTCVSSQPHSKLYSSPIAPLIWIFNGGSTFNFAIVFLCELVISSRFVCSVLTEIFFYTLTIFILCPCIYDMCWYFSALLNAFVYHTLWIYHVIARIIFWIIIFETWCKIYELSKFCIF